MELDEEQVAVIRSASLMLHSLTTTFQNPSTGDPIRGAAAQNFNNLLECAQEVFLELSRLRRIARVVPGDSLPGLIPALGNLVGSLPDLPSLERRSPGFTG